MCLKPILLLFSFVTLFACSLSAQGEDVLNNIKVETIGDNISLKGNGYSIALKSVRVPKSIIRQKKQKKESDIFANKLNTAFEG